MLLCFYYTKAFHHFRTVGLVKPVSIERIKPFICLIPTPSKSKAIAYKYRAFLAVLFRPT